MTDLSPQARAVLNAADSVFDEAGTTNQGIAAALRAAADQAHHHWDGMECVDHLCAIAAELDNTPQQS
jgi:hypothetical protein